MLERNDAITARQADLVDAVVHLRAELRTIAINRDVFAAVAVQTFRRVADKLRHLLIERWIRGTELQAGNDIGYIEPKARVY